MSRAPRAACVFALVSIASAAHAGADAVEAGAAIYGDYCSSCHGDQLRNTSGGVTSDLRRMRPEDRDRFFTVVLDGRNQMPPWRGALETKQIEAVWAYIRAAVDK